MVLLACTLALSILEASLGLLGRSFKTSKFESPIMAMCTTNIPNFSLDLDKRTFECLDFGVVLDELRAVTVTVQGSEISSDRKSSIVEER